MAWMKNTSGKKDAVFTLAVVAFFVVVVKMLFAGTSLILGDNVFTIGDIDAATIAAILTPTLGAYVSRRYTDKKYNSDEKVTDHRGKDVKETA